MIFLLLVLAGALILGMPIGFALLLAGIAGTAAVGVDLRIIPMRIFSGMDSFQLLAIPAFLFAGEIMMRGGILQRVLRLMVFFIGKLRGGTAMASTFANLLMAGISGSAAADAAGIGRLMIPTMVREGYKPGYAASVTAAASIVGPIIPPSVLFIVASGVSKVSVIDLFIGGIVPGCLIILALLLLIAWQARRLNFPLPMAQDTGRSTAELIWDTLIVAIIPVFVLTGLRVGLLTPTEAAGIVALISIAIGMFVTRQLQPGALWQASAASVRTSANIYMIIAGASCCAYVLSVGGIDGAIRSFVENHDLSNMSVVMISVLITFVLGLFLEPTVILILVMPMFIPYASDIGTVAFVIIITVTACIGLITPPVGICLAITTKIAGTSVSETVVYLIPMLVTAIGVLVLLIAYPALITLWI